MRLAAPLLPLLLLAGCGGGPGGENAGITANQLERLAKARPEPVGDPQLAARPQSLVRADLEGAGMPSPGCDFSKNGHMLLAATPDDAIARVDGRLHHFNHSSPVGPTGGFFEDRQLSISVGRVAETTSRAGRWTARMTATNRRANAQVEIVGTWRCG
ncbi:MAG TPA: hypothetical protein VGO55_18525 [Allosphingosinicella sp.]|jgi:hypothetical protein|nr:hypothetical protein [Allosphingosinicella sp.]